MAEAVENIVRKKAWICINKTIYQLNVKHLLTSYVLAQRNISLDYVVKNITARNSNMF